MNSWFNNCFI